MAYLEKVPRIGRSQGAVIFWGLVSAFFATAFCYYFLKNRTNEENARSLTDQVMSLQTERDSLGAERDKIEAAAADTDKQLKAREEFLQEKETKLAEEESRLDAMGAQTQNKSQFAQRQAATIKKFDETARKLVAKTQDADVVLRGGRPVLRVPSSVFFAFGDTQLLPAGKALLGQVAQALDGATDDFELRIETFTDTAGEVVHADATGPTGIAPADQVFVDASAKAADKDKKKDVPAKTPATVATADTKRREANSWTLTADRAAALAHYLHDRNTLPFTNVLAMGRGDFQPVVPNAAEGHAKNRRVEITLTPVPPFFRSPEADKDGKAKTNASAALSKADAAKGKVDAASPESAAPVDPLAPPPDPPASHP